MPGEELWFNTPVSDLCREERWKHEKNPLAIWDKVLQYSSQNQPPSDDDRFRLKYLGLFHVAPAQDSFMLRLRVPGGVLSTHQLRGLAQLAEDYGSGRADLTTRSNLQIREFQPRDIVRVLNRVQALGLTSRGSGADNIRNITASPITGIDPNELIDVAPLAEAMQAYITNSRDMYELPRKFNIAFDNGGSISVLADTNDIGFVAVRVTEGPQLFPPGIYFRVLLCGITGHRQFATDCGAVAASGRDCSRRRRDDPRLQSARRSHRSQEGAPEIPYRPLGYRAFPRRDRKASGVAAHSCRCI